MKKKIKNKLGLTLLEVLISASLLAGMVAAVFVLYNASQVFYFTANSKVIISYEFQYAAEHIYKNVMRAIGDEISAPGSRAIQVSNEGETLSIRINNNALLTKDNYDDVGIYEYSKSGDAGDELIFNDGDITESLVRKVTVTEVIFSYDPEDPDADGNLLTISLTGSYRGQAFTFYSSCYPRLASFQ